MYMKVSVACGQNVIDDIANELYHAGVDAAEDGSCCPECGEELEPYEEESSLEVRKMRVARRAKEVRFSSESDILPGCNLGNPYRYLVCANDGNGWTNEAGFFDAAFAIDFFQEYAAIMKSSIVRLYDREKLTCREHNPFS